MNEKEFLANYDKSEFSSPLLSVDAALFTYHEGQIKVLLVKRSAYPDKHKWALPGGFIDEKDDKTLTDTVYRKLKEKTGVKTPYIEQLASFGGANRDKRGWSVTVVYTAMVAHQACSSHIDSVEDVCWMTLADIALLKLAFDHADIIQAAHERLKQKALYSIVPAFTLPKKFTLPNLQQVHEALVGKTLEKKSFRRRILQADLIEETGESRSDGSRPAKLYRMKPGARNHTFMRNLES